MKTTTSTTREGVKALVAERGDWTLAELAFETGVSRERVRQIIKTEGLVIVRPSAATRQPSPPQPRLLTGGVAVRLSCTCVGRVSELLAAADLLVRGYTVYFPLLQQSASCDLLAMDGAKIERIEVRSGHRKKDGKITYARKTQALADRYAIVLTGEPVTYEPPLDGD